MVYLCRIESLLLHLLQDLYRVAVGELALGALGGLRLEELFLDPSQSLCPHVIVRQHRLLYIFAYLVK